MWGIILSYFNPVLYQKVASFLKNLTWVEFTSAVSQVDFKGIGSFLTFASFLLSITIILLFSTNSFKWKAMRKVKEDKYEKVIKHNEQLEGLLCDISYKSKLNIDTLNHMIPYLPNMFSELITQTDKYSLEKDSLKKLDNKGSHSNTKLDDLVSGYESFQEQINKINEILKDIQDSRLLYVFSKVNKSARYEILELGLFFRTSLDQTLIEGEGFKKAIEERKRKLSRLTKDFIQINEVLNGWLKKEEFIKEYNKNGSSFTFEQIVKFKERKLKDAMIEFKRFLHQRLEDAMHHHIILIEYLEISHYNTKFSLVKTILSLFGPK
ncbi:hypothetical protein [Brevibacillus laterosporus]|uniref:hypothetical protein n=1 Tax=Brevibacillus laterosporus TaxID=1465 RepID=UPI003D19C788